MSSSVGPALYGLSSLSEFEAIHISHEAGTELEHSVPLPSDGEDSISRPELVKRTSWLGKASRSVASTIGDPCNR
jgi:hypothetical protein